MSLATKLHEGMRKHVEKTRGEKKEKKDPGDKEVNKTGKVDHFEVHPAEGGGHILETHFERSGSYDKPTPEPHKSIHKTMGSAMKEMKESCPCGICAGGESDTGVVEKE